MRVTGEAVDVSAMRVGYRSGGDDDLEPDWLTGEPIWLDLFERWLAEAVAAQVPEPNAMVVATVDPDGAPATRTVLCKAVDARGIVFYTNFGSDKGRHLDANPVASATFPWVAMERQVHVRGAVVRVDRDETAAYWDSRPRGSRLGAVASDQSRPIESREALAQRADEAERRFGASEDDGPIPLPDGWGGFRIEPRVVEFWQGRANRLHNRVRATRTDDGWTVARLQP